MVPVRDYFISHKKPIALVLFLTLLGGMFAYSKLQTSLFPDVTFPKIKIIAEEVCNP